MPAAGRDSGPPLSTRLKLADIVFRRSTADNAGLRDDTMPAVTARFRRENGVPAAPPARPVGWWL